MLPTQPIRVGMIGYGGSGRTFHSRLIRALPDFDLIGVMPTSESAREALIVNDPPVQIVDSIDEMVGLGVELAVVVTPDAAHAAGIEAALDAGMHVVVEKPLAVTVSEGERMVALAADRGRLLVPFHNRRWDSDFLTVRKLVDSGELGRVIRFDTRFKRWAPSVGPNWRDVARPGTLDGRLADLGSHLVDQATVLFGPVSSVYAEVRAVRDGAEANDDSFMAMTHASGTVTHVHMTSVSAPRLPRFIVQGLDAGFQKFGDDPQAPDLARGRRLDDPQWGSETAEDEGVLTDRMGESRRVPTERGDWSQFYRLMATAIRGEGTVPVDSADALAGLRVLEAAAISARDGAVVRLA